ncbi:hypothetical protein U879_02535 [Defluviimonas sp. 20V17]|uniref:Helix-turn-helix domain containing protein n=1 Tax=Allgaiera indica TaxID=765699 RepID=A0AAN5A1X1_9RHOB|nr:DUF6456 domain-containing protein [Allgaiera indica]KDB05215.1 hypothetical protein U879_02535 [Defluviimonas sp. 20V17]GHE04948.1 helix-turn-helix domain containing protein [Allgaiera indica]SDX60053.1 hypothetical protein SAMN05444006_12125 [Allgaiera indica]
MRGNLTANFTFPAWLPDAARLYLGHTEIGLSLRELARQRGIHASTVLRRVRRYENRRDDPLVDEALARIGRACSERAHHLQQKEAKMTAPIRSDASIEDDATLQREARRILRRLAEPGSVLAVAPDMDKAAVLRDLPEGRTARTAVVARNIAQAFALRDWIACRKQGRVATYEITPAGKAALKRMLAADGGAGGAVEGAARGPGFAEAATPFGDQHRDWEERDTVDNGRRQRIRYNLAESPVAALARRRDRDGKPFLSADLVRAAERLREDFEIAQMGPRVAQNWDRFLTGGDRGGFAQTRGPAEGPRAARDRVAAALRDLGPGLGDMVLRCCCYLEGLEGAEKRLGWSARSGKIVLRIALMRLKRHYDETGGNDVLIG